ncbi:KTSC domain-containing protein [Pedobacter antarcticus]|uniref:Molecular chaperone DnaJ n=2 Tax=Pedobacter antarcticus TaxID=34086 RepID=A0A081PJC1_9SPHI|nr:KTSC domain-containing protein [Pedobacter antarcticus]KEQ30794.1 molecular chaperone DnaJ [Pedobacter antarcticus 4BY]SDM41669.1 DnaJ domain-containing protein [Pedobacter antarcticus]SFE92847.1 DnaJ domain-containing protein [Pedobacter antarcticus]
MKKIVDYRKLLGVQKDAELKELKTIYRNLMKEYHPDKFQESDEAKTAAEVKSKEIIEAYHFLVSIAPETLEGFIEEYTNTISSCGIADYNWAGLVLTVHFLDGSAYEYFEVPKAIYVKLVNADSPGRFARRHIFNSFPYRNIVKLETA